MDSEQIQLAINDAVRQKDVWTAELMRLNKELASAKVGKRASLRKAIKNAEEQIADYNRSLKKLNDDLARVLKAEVKNADNLELAKQGISPGSKIAETIGKTAESLIPTLQGSLASKRSAELNMEAQTEKPNYLYWLIGLAVLLFLMMKKK